MTGVSPATQDGADDSARVDPMHAQPRASEYAVDGHGGAQVSRHVLRTNQVRLAVPSSAR